MIAYLQGKILEKTAAYIILENQGVGYKVFVTPEILEQPLGQELRLYVYHKVAEDSQALFGLSDFESLQLFELLVTVSGVGPKVALAILSAARVSDIRQAIASQDSGIFTRISGVGTKTAEKIIIELKNKVIGSGSPAAGASEVFDALLALGYKQNEVRSVISKVDGSLTQGEQIKQALKFLSK